MLHATTYIKFTTSTGTTILIPSTYTLAVAERMAKTKDATATYAGIHIEW